jgi:hypothetical protein
LPAELPPLRLLLIMDNLAGHKTRAFVEWLLAHGVMPLYTLERLLVEHGVTKPIVLPY